MEGLARGAFELLPVGRVAEASAPARPTVRVHPLTHGDALEDPTVDELKDVTALGFAEYLRAP